VEDASQDCHSSSAPRKDHRLANSRTQQLIIAIIIAYLLVCFVSQTEMKQLAGIFLQTRSSRWMSNGNREMMRREMGNQTRRENNLLILENVLLETDCSRTNCNVQSSNSEGSGATSMA